MIPHRYTALTSLRKQAPKLTVELVRRALFATSSFTALSGA